MTEYRLNQTGAEVQGTLDQVPVTQEQLQQEVSDRSEVVGALDERVGNLEQDSYQKPADGIPKNDLANGVQESLNKADNALQSQEQADWNESDSTKASFIKNKPIIPDVSNKADKATTLAGYGITDGYTKTEGQELESEVDGRLDAQDAAIALLNGSEVIVVADHTDVTEVPNPDPQKIYREYGTNSYTDYMCVDATTTPVTWKPLATYGYPGVDNVPTADSEKLVKSGGVKDALNELGFYVGDTEWVMAVTDSEGKILAGIKADGSVEWSVGVPTPVKKYVDVNFVNIETVDAIVESVEEIKEVSPVVVESQKYIEVTTDSDNKVLYGVADDGNFVFGKGVPKQITDFVAPIAEDVERLRNNLNNVMLPEYYFPYIQNKVDEFRDVLLNSSDGHDDFIFITDPHWRTNRQKSPLLIEYLLSKGVTNKVINGGDVCNAYSTEQGGLNDILNEISLNMEFAASVQKYGRYFMLRGNHDFNGYPGTPTQKEQGTIEFWRASNIATRNIILQGMEKSGIVCMPDNEYTTYYFDEPNSKIRYIALYVLYRPTENVQLPWVINNAILTCPHGYNIVFMNHVNVAEIAYDDKGATIVNNLTDVFNLVNAIQNHEEITLFGTSYDFTNLDVNVAAFMGGHSHRDMQTIINGVAYITTACDATYNGYNSPAGRVTEQIFDIISLDCAANRIRCLRVGAGYNRTFNTEKNEIAVNGTIQLSSTLSNVTWYCYDSDRYSAMSSDAVVGNPIVYASGIPIPTNTYASVDSNGLVTGLASGESVIYATDANGNKEFFSVNIV